MAYAHSLFRLTYSGTCFGSREIWSTGLFIADPAADVGSASQTAVDDYAAQWSVFFGLSANKFSNAYTTTQTKLQKLDTAGHPVPGETYYNTALVTTGAYGGNPQVPQASIVASLRATAIHGLGTHGRMYLPGSGFVVDPSTGGISSTDQNTLATAFQLLINQINTYTPSPTLVSLCSKGTTLPTVQPGVTQTVTHVEIGNYYDTQRRRRNGFTEAYVNKSIP